MGNRECKVYITSDLLDRELCAPSYAEAISYADGFTGALAAYYMLNGFEGNIEFVENEAECKASYKVDGDLCVTIIPLY